MSLDLPANQFHWRKFNTSNETGVFYEVPKGSMSEKPKRKNNQEPKRKLVQSEAVSPLSKIRRTSNLENVESTNEDIHQTSYSEVPEDHSNEYVQKPPLFNKKKKRISHMKSHMPSANLNISNDVVGDIIKSFDRPIPSPKTITTVPAKRLHRVKKVRQSCPNFGSSKAAPLLSNCKRQTKSLCKRINSSKHQRAHMGSTLAKQTLDSSQSKLQPDIHKKNELQAVECSTVKNTIRVSNSTVVKKTTGQQSKTFADLEQSTIKTTGHQPKIVTQKTTGQQSKTFTEVLEQLTIKTISQQPKTVIRKTSRHQPKTVIRKTSRHQPKTVIQKTTSQKQKTVAQKTSVPQPKAAEILEQPTIVNKVLPKKVSALKKKVKENKSSETTKKNGECKKNKYKKVCFLESETESDEESSCKKGNVRESPRLTEDAPESPGVVSDAPESPGVVSDAPESPGVVSDAPESPGVVSDAPESPGVVSDAPESPGVVSDAPESPGVVSDAPESPPCEICDMSVGESSAQILSAISSLPHMNEMSLTSITNHASSSTVVPDIITLSDEEDDIINISDDDETDQDIIYLEEVPRPSEEVPRPSVRTLFRRNNGLPRPRLDEKTKMLRRLYFANSNTSVQEFLDHM